MSRTRDLVHNILQWQANLLASFFWLFQRPDAEWWMYAQVPLPRYANVCAVTLWLLPFLLFGLNQTKNLSSIRQSNSVPQLGLQHSVTSAHYSEQRFNQAVVELKSSLSKTNMVECCSFRNQSKPSIKQGLGFGPATRCFPSQQCTRVGWVGL